LITRLSSADTRRAEAAGATAGTGADWGRRGCGAGVVNEVDSSSN
jgi:hypothetical protein